MKDRQGILRGKCILCGCREFEVDGRSAKCRCGHTPVRHEAQLLCGSDESEESDDSDGVEWDSIESLSRDHDDDMVGCSSIITRHATWTGTSDSSSPDNQLTMEAAACTTPLCQVPGCQEMADFDLNTQQLSVYCRSHLLATAQPMQLGGDTSVCPAMCHPPTLPTAMGKVCALQGCGMACFVSEDGTTYDYCSKTHAMAGPSTLPSQDGSGTVCAIPECSNACFVDGQGKVHECCGYTHAMEYQRRKALSQAPVVKGITHCLLPECHSPVWPFMNYCGRSHADQGKQRGLMPPTPTPTPTPQHDQGTKPANCCILPGCMLPKYVDPSTNSTHPYCGKTHAEQAKKLGIFETTDQVSDQCDLPGCTRAKRREPDGSVRDYCCTDHAKQDAPNRDAQILTTRSEVDKYLQKFSLKVVKLEENSHAKPGGALFNKFKQKYMSLPKHLRVTQLAFHGTVESNIQSICSNGYDPSKRSGQSYGSGEYFAISPSTPLTYCRGGKKLLLNELLLGQNGTHHTKHGDIIVMKDSAHDLPRFVITLQ